MAVVTDVEVPEEVRREVALACLLAALLRLPLLGQHSAWLDEVTTSQTLNFFRFLALASAFTRRCTFCSLGSPRRCSASHSWQRALSAAAGIGLVAVTGLLAAEVTRSRAVATSSALLVAVLRLRRGSVATSNTRL